MSTTLKFYRGTGLASCLIRWFTGSKYSHVAPCVNGRIYDAFWKGVSVRNATPADDLVSTLNVSEDDLKWQSWLDSKVGEPYDKFAIFLIIVDRPLPSWLHIDEARQGCWWCSHLSAVVAGLEDNNEPITPQELYKRLAEKGYINVHNQ